jgi:hypothetical protein
MQRGVRGLSTIVGAVMTRLPAIECTVIAFHGYWSTPLGPQTKMLSEEFIGKTLRFWVSDPFEYGNDDNLTPLELKIVKEDVVSGRRILAVVGQFQYGGKTYRNGLLRPRHGDDLLLIFSMGSRGSSVNARFVPPERDNEIDIVKMSIAEIQKAMTSPNTDWGDLVGDIKVVCHS